MTRRVSLLRPSLLFFASVSLALPAFAQDADSARSRTTLAGLVTVTNKGISTVPSFTLGKPAAILDVFIARSGFSFDPQFRWGLDGKPWSILFWGRYTLPNRGNFHMTIGGHPALNFRTVSVTTNQVEKDVIEARRFLAGELYPSYTVAKNVSVGTYYLYSHGFEQDAPKNMHFVALRTTFASVPLSDRYFIRFVPQVYYLKVDARDGYYVNSTLTVAKHGFPLSIGSQVNRTIKTTILEGDDLLWNLSVSYSIR